MTETQVARPITPSALRGLVAKYTRSGGSRRLLVVKAAPVWEGPETVDSEVGPLRVVCGNSVLAVRAALVDHPDERLIVLTPYAMAELGEEVGARAFRGVAQSPSSMDGVMALFRVDGVDPSLRGEQWMIELLVNLAPAKGYPQPTSQILDRATAWRTLYRAGLGLTTDRPTTADLIEWASTGAAADAATRLDADGRGRVAQQLSIEAGSAAGPLVHLAGKFTSPHDPLALGLVIDALWPDPDRGSMMALQAIHLERRPLTADEAKDWGDAAVVELRRRLTADVTSEDVREILARAEAILDEVDTTNDADSAVLDRGFEHRLTWLGTQLAGTLDAGESASMGNAERALLHLRDHVRATGERARLDAAAAAVRLVRRQLSIAPPTDQVAEVRLRDLAMDYLDDGAWVDAARHRVAEGETNESLAAVYKTLVERVDADRGTRDRRFAGTVAAEGASLTASDELRRERPLPIEDVLSRVLAPVARQAPVLLLVLDGLSHFAAVPMLEDLRKAGWREVGPEGHSLPPSIAALPTVTNVSRSSLLSGRLQTGTQDVEREGFHNHADLIEAGSGAAPRLFHKRDLRPQDGGVAPEVREAILDRDQRVLGIVVNGVDDHLDRGSQLRLADGLDGVPVLKPLLAAAAEAGRVVVLTSDHGHILGSHQRVVSASGGGERFRITPEPPVEDEVEVTGRRVLRGDGRVVLGADDGVRYIAVAKHGYHGGATPAEVLCPLSVLVPGAVQLEGWEAVTVAAPSWWDPSSAKVDIDLAAPAPPPSGGGQEKPQLSLLDPAPAPVPTASAGVPAWLTTLLESDRLALQRDRAGRVSIDDDDLGLILRVLVAAGGTASGESLRRTLDLPGSRLRGKLEAARKLLDVDDYQILKIETDGTAVLNIELLGQQFRVEIPSAGAR